MKKILLATLASFGLLLTCTVLAGEDSLTIEISAGQLDRESDPVTLRLPADWAGKKHLVLKSDSGDKSLPVQKIDSNSIASFFVDPLNAGEKRRYQLSASEEPIAQTDRVTCVDENGRLSLLYGDRPILRYNYAIQKAPEGIDPVYNRSGYIHPLYSPDGRELTGDFPADHAHQHALFNPWVNTVFEGREVDFWNQAKETGMIEHARILNTFSGPVCGGVTISLRHIDRSAPGGPKEVLNETWTVRAWKSGGQFVVDLKSVQKCSSNSKLTMKEYRYGGMALRGNHQWFDAKLATELNRFPKKLEKDPTAKPSVCAPFEFLTSEGHDVFSGNHTAARWVNMSGKIDGNVTGTTVLSHPKNFRAPQKVRLHPSKPYFCFAPMVDGDFVIESGSPYVSRYRYLLRDGKPDANDIDRSWEQYAAPMVARTIGRP